MLKKSKTYQALFFTFSFIKKLFHKIYFLANLKTSNYSIEDLIVGYRMKMVP